MAAAERLVRRAGDGSDSNAIAMNAALAALRHGEADSTCPQGEAPARMSAQRRLPCLAWRLQYTSAQNDCRTIGTYPSRRLLSRRNRKAARRRSRHAWAMCAPAVAISSGGVTLTIGVVRRSADWTYVGA